MNNFPKILKFLRTSNNLTQQELGDKINVTKVSISGYENGTRTPDVETLISIAEVFEVALDTLIGRNVNDPLIFDALPLLNNLSKQELDSLFILLNRF